MVKNLPAMQETQVQPLGWEDPPEKEMATHSGTLAWKIPWTEEPGRLQSMGSQRVRHDWATSLTLPGKSQGVSSLPPLRDPPFEKILISLFVWLHWVLVMAWRIPVDAHRLLSCCGAPAQLPHSMWGLSSSTRDWTSILCIGRQILNHWTTREVPQGPSFPRNQTDIWRGVAALQVVYVFTLFSSPDPEIWGYSLKQF